MVPAGTWARSCRSRADRNGAGGVQRRGDAPPARHRRPLRAPRRSRVECGRRLVARGKPCRQLGSIRGTGPEKPSHEASGEDEREDDGKPRQPSPGPDSLHAVWRSEVATSGSREHVKRDEGSPLELGERLPSHRAAVRAAPWASGPAEPAPSSISGAEGGNREPMDMGPRCRPLWRAAGTRASPFAGPS